MRKSIALTVIVLMAATTFIGATEMKGTTSIGLRVPVLMPLKRGVHFEQFGYRNQPFMMGWDIAAEAKYAISNHFKLGLTAGYTTTYDDTTGENHRNLHLNNSDNAYSKLTGVLVGVIGEYYYNTEWKFQPYLLGGLGVDLWSGDPETAGETYKSTDLNAKIGTGLFIPLTEQLAIDILAKASFEFANLSTDMTDGAYGPTDWSTYSDRPFLGYFEPSIGLTYAFGGAIDSDHDGVADGNDNCPGTPMGAKVDKSGCPLDADGDGVYDGLDKCPDTPKGATVDATGCPLDSDKDGVYDGLDKCPGTPAGLEVDKFGCPYDADQDGVADSLDKCLGTPKGIKVDATGCPFEKRITEKITLHINYASNSYEPDAQAKKDLDAIAPRIYAYPDTKVEIRGFTDDQGTEEHNLTLSQNRANGVMEYLKSKGVPENQMIAKGYGEDPKYFVGDNKT
ncbi:MAG: OmpA family protein, partial [candidate division Zixibacteria bacterium]|nr:OmpA family protein [candidate division Zixibacteria bacterium]